MARIITAELFPTAMSELGTWNLPDKALTEDGVYTSVHLLAASYSGFLGMVGFGANIPSGASIKAVQARFKRYASSTTVVDSAIYLRNAAGILGNNKSTGAALPTVLTNNYFGDLVNDLWGNASLTPAIVNDAEFGVKINLYSGATKDAYIDVITLQIVYETADFFFVF